MTKEERLSRVKAAKEARQSAGATGSTSTGPVNDNLPLFSESVILSLKTGGIPSEIERMAKENFVFGQKAENYTRDYVAAFHRSGLKKTHSNAISIMVDMVTDFYVSWSEGYDPAIIPGPGALVLGKASELDEILAEESSKKAKPKAKAKK